MAIKKFFKYLALLCVAILLLFIVVYWAENGRVEDTGFIPNYDKRDELEALIEKGRVGRLTREESERLHWLSEDQLRQVEKQYQEWRKNNK